MNTLSLRPASCAHVHDDDRHDPGWRGRCRRAPLRRRRSGRGGGRAARFPRALRRAARGSTAARCSGGGAAAAAAAAPQRRVLVRCASGRLRRRSAGAARRPEPARAPVAARGHSTRAVRCRSRSRCTDARSPARARGAARAARAVVTSDPTATAPSTLRYATRGRPESPSRGDRSESMRHIVSPSRLSAPCRSCCRRRGPSRRGDRRSDLGE